MVIEVVPLVVVVARVVVVVVLAVVVVVVVVEMRNSDQHIDVVLRRQNVATVKYLDCEVPVNSNFVERY